MGDHRSLVGLRVPFSVPLAALWATRRGDGASLPLPVGRLTLIGFLGGLFGGLLGIGGGSVIAPLLLLTGGLRAAQVSGTTLATVLVISMVGVGAHASLGHVDLSLVWPIAMGSVVGSVLGALWAKRFSRRLMGFVFLVLLPYFTIKQLLPSFAAPALATNLPTLGILGFVTGTFGGLLGISGASLIVPSLSGFFLIEHHAAQGIAMGVALVDSLAGAATHAHGRNVHYGVVLSLGVPALVAAAAGVGLSSLLSDSVLRYIFGTFMAALFVMMLARWLKGGV